MIKRLIETSSTNLATAGKVVRKAIENRKATAIIAEKEYYPEDTDIDIEDEIDRIYNLEKSSENIHRLENLKRIRTVRTWFGKWFENDARTDCRQFVRHTNWKFYWPWHPETVIVDTTFVDVYKDGTVTVKQFGGHPFLIDHAETHYTEVTGKITLNRVEKWLKNPTETFSFDKLM